MAKKLPSQMNTAELWEWHAGVYAFRRVALGVPQSEQTSPCDPTGVWFNAARVDAAERRLRSKRLAEKEMYEEQRRREEIARGWRSADEPSSAEVADEWARQRGFADIDEYILAERIDWSEALKRVMHSILAAASMPGDANAKFNPHDAAEALGVKAREYQPTAEQLKAGRRELGLEPEDANL